MFEIYLKNNINNSIASALYRYGNYYDSLETDIDIHYIIEKQKKIRLILNNKVFKFVSTINILFENDFDNKFNFKYLPEEINDLINTYLVDEKSLKFNLYYINYLYNIHYEFLKVNNLMLCKIKFSLKDDYIDKMSKFLDFKDYINQIPLYLLNNKNFGIEIQSNINRNIKIISTLMNYNNEAFHKYTEKYSNKILI